MGRGRLRRLIPLSLAGRASGATISLMTFDTHAAVRTLEDSGLTSRQAEAVTTTIRVAIAEGTATKEDIYRLEACIANSEARLIKWMVGVGMASVGLAVAGAGLLLRIFG